VIPYTIGAFLSKEIRTPAIKTNTTEFDQAEQGVKDRIDKLFSIRGDQSVESLHRQLGKIMWDYCGMARTKEGLEFARREIKKLRDTFWASVYVPGKPDEFNPELDKANRVADFLELGEVMIVDALNRNESCGGHFREEYQDSEGEALRQDDLFSYVAAWSWNEGNPELSKEPLKFENVELKSRSYK
jgi:succinate dehydrogenase / fumarate reductase flavoprotein subunit